MADYDPQPPHDDAWERRFKQGYLPIDSSREYSFSGPSPEMYPPNALMEQQQWTQRYDTPFDAQANQQGNYPRYDPNPFVAQRKPSEPGSYPNYDPSYPGKETITQLFGDLTSRPTYPSGAPPAPQPPTGAPPAPGAAQQFMGMQPPATGGAAAGFEGPKRQDQLGQYGGAPSGVKGDPWRASGGAPQPPQGGGAPSGGGAPQQYGQVTLRGVWDSLAQANPHLLKTREGRITLGMAAAKFTPLMRQDEQLEMQRMKMEMNNQIQMLKLQQGESKIELLGARTEAQIAKLEGGGAGAGAFNKERNELAKEANKIAKDLAATPGNKNLQARYDDTMGRLKAIDEQINPIAQDKAYADFITKNPNRVEETVPDDVKRILNPAEFQQLLERLRGDPAGGHARIQMLRKKARGGETTMGKSYGNY